MNPLYVVLGIIAAFLFGLFSSKRISKDQAKVIDLQSKIEENQDKLVVQEKSADEKLKEYNEALKAYDPTFHDDDDSSGHSA
jgi:hypothetical protein